MSKAATVLEQFVTATAITGVFLLAAPFFLAQPVWAQSPVAPSANPDWYHVGNSLVDFSLAGLAGGPVDRVWYSPDGATLYAITSSGKTFETQTFETWRTSATPAPSPADLSTSGTPLPEPGARLRGFNGQRSTLYAFGAFVYQSQNEGASWDNLTAYGPQSIVGGAARDLAVSPRDPEEVTVATFAGVYRSLNGGKSWSGLNQGLPNLPALRIRALPQGSQGAQVELPGASVVEWQPGEKRAWRPADSTPAVNDAQLRSGLASTAVETRANAIYQGSADGVFRVTIGEDTLQFATPNGGPVERFWVDAADSRIALAVLGARPENAPAGVPSPHVFHTVDGGRVWDDLTKNLADVAVHGVTASTSGRAIYIATDAGVFSMRTDVSVLGLPAQWQALSGLPTAPVADVRLDSGDNQLWAAVEGFGLYSVMAPHRVGDPKVVNAANLIASAASPGSAMTILGAKVSSAQAGGLAVPVLISSDTESQIQIPFDARGTTLPLSYTASGNRVVAPLTLAPASPGILVSPGGTPCLIDAATGTMLDASNPAHSHARIQILATGLGRVTPDCPLAHLRPRTTHPRSPRRSLRT